MINNKSDKPEKLKPQDSKQKNIQHPQDDTEAVVKPEDKKYREEDADFDGIQKKRERDEQPVNPIRKAPKED